LTVTTSVEDPVDLYYEVNPGFGIQGDVERRTKELKK
jgi:hypothetical protein